MCGCERVAWQIETAQMRDVNRACFRHQQGVSAEAGAGIRAAGYQAS